MFRKQYDYPLEQNYELLLLSRLLVIAIFTINGFIKK